MNSLETPNEEWAEPCISQRQRGSSRNRRLWLYCVLTLTLLCVLDESFIDLVPKKGGNVAVLGGLQPSTPRCGDRSNGSCP